MSGSWLILELRDQKQSAGPHNLLGITLVEWTAEPARLPLKDWAGKPVLIQLNLIQLLIKDSSAHVIGLNEIDLHPKYQSQLRSLNRSCFNKMWLDQEDQIRLDEVLLGNRVRSSRKPDHIT